MSKYTNVMFKKTKQKTGKRMPGGLSRLSFANKGNSPSTKHHYVCMAMSWDLDGL